MKAKFLLLISLTIFTFAAIPSYSSTRFSDSAGQYFAPPEKFLRTELYFGMNRMDGGIVTEEEWSKFLNDVVTPLFPAGLTVIDAYGQFREDNGNIGKEKSRMLILLYPKKTRQDSDKKINAIRAAYVKTFNQQSVMRVDMQTLLVSFKLPG